LHRVKNQKKRIRKIASHVHEAVINIEKEKPMNEIMQKRIAQLQIEIAIRISDFKNSRFFRALSDDRGDVPGWVLVVLMTTGLVTAIWTIAAPRLSAILKNSLDAMNGIR
jgi:hypothetical protein